jgi:hypothetical protein
MQSSTEAVEITSSDPETNEEDSEATAEGLTSQQEDVSFEGEETDVFDEVGRNGMLTLTKCTLTWLVKK